VQKTPTRKRPRHRASVELIVTINYVLDATEQG
jgi:hypothetical protein